MIKIHEPQDNDVAMRCSSASQRSAFQFEPYGVTLVVEDAYVPDDSEIICNCAICDRRYVEYQWCHDVDALDICPGCMHNAQKVRGRGIRQSWNYIGGGNRKTLISTEECRQLDQLALAVWMLEKEIKCKSN